MIITTKQFNLLKEIDEYVFKLTGDEGEDDSWTVLKNYIRGLLVARDGFNRAAAEERFCCPAGIGFREYIQKLEGERDMAERDSGLYCATLKKSAELLGCEEHLVDNQIEGLQAENRRLQRVIDEYQTRL